MTTNHRFVCAFRGARDRYQAALALAEADALQTLITDAYLTPAARRWAALLPASMRARLAERHADGLPADRVHCLWSTTVHEHLRHRLGFSRRSTWLKLDRAFGEAAASEARRTRAQLLMYSPYAWEAFTARYAHEPRRVLFQYHPHPELETRLLAEDSAAHAGIGESFNDSGAEAIDIEALNRERNSWRHADAIICSSAFTRRSLVEAGCDAAICHVVPYGVDLPPAPPRHGVTSGFQALFVGSGGQRKGLHHLLLAWQRATLPQESSLTLVCRAIDRGMAALAAKTPRVRIINGATAEQLEALYASSTLFVMPSLVEGFGHVYLEALARGCPVLGTANTALPDIGGDADGVFLTEAGNIDMLSATLARLAETLPHAAAVRAAARATAERYPWSAFRAGLRSVAQA